MASELIEHIGPSGAFDYETYLQEKNQDVLYDN
jgi:hypothetical protein